MACSKCNNGLIPHPAIPYAFLDCECKEVSTEWHRPKPEDIDFPMSRDMYRSYAEVNHWPDPGPMIEKEPERIIIEKGTDLQPIQSQLNYILNKITSQKTTKPESSF